MYEPHEMSDVALLEELDFQNEWATMDAGESAFFGRGDGGLKRSNVIAALYAEAVKRGLKEPLPLLPEDMPQFAAVCEAMAGMGFKWNHGGFSKFDPVTRYQVERVDFETAEQLLEKTP